MDIKIVKSEKLKKLLGIKKIHISEMMNGIIDISTYNDINARQNIELVISQILSDNPDLLIISVALETSTQGTSGAIAFFISKRQLFKEMLDTQID